MNIGCFCSFYLKSLLLLLALSQVTGVSLSKELTQQQEPTLKVTWNASQSDENVTEYHVQYKRGKDRFWRTQITITGSPPRTSQLLTALNAGIAYDVRVRARSGSKNGAWSEVQTETTYSSEFKCCYLLLV